VGDAGQKLFHGKNLIQIFNQIFGAEEKYHKFSTKMM
jgi:hypothetical protein